MNGWQTVANNRLDGLVYLVFGIIWIVTQIANAKMKKRKQESAGSTSPLSTPSQASSSIPTAETKLREFLSELAGVPPMAKPPGLPLPAPATPVESAELQEFLKEMKIPLPKASSLPRRSSAASLRAQKRVPRLRENPWPSDASPLPSPSVQSVSSVLAARAGVASVPAVRGMTPGGGKRSSGKTARTLLRGPRSREAMRDAFVWKTLLEPPRALQPVGGDSLWESREG